MCCCCSSHPLFYSTVCSFDTEIDCGTTVPYSIAHYSDTPTFTFAGKSNHYYTLAMVHRSAHPLFTLTLMWIE